MHKIQLKTGEARELVAVVQIPEFKPLYPILLWGDRFFQYHSKLMKPGGEEIEHINYTEVACYAIVGQSEAIPDGGD